MRPYLILAAAALVAFGASLLHGFHFDDWSLLYDPKITQAGGWQAITNLWQTRPLTWLTFWINYQVNGPSPLSWHAVNLLLHALNSALLLAVLRPVLSMRVAWMAAALFAIHPIQAESVAYVYSRGTELCTAFCLLAWMSRQRNRKWLAVVWFTLALLSKEECAAFPLFLWLTEVRVEQVRASRLERWSSLAAMLALSVVAGVHVLLATAHTPQAGAGFQAGITPVNYLAAQPVAIVRYLRLILVPWGFTIDPEISLFPWVLGASWVVVCACILGALRLAPRSTAALYFLGGLILLLPSSSIFPASDLAADHRVYLPMIAFAVSAALLLQRARPSILAASGITLLAVTWTRMPVWASDRALWSEAAARAPHHARPLIQLSRAVSAPEALALLDKAESIAPNDAKLLSERGKVYLNSGRPAEALREFGRALALSPNDPHAINNRGVALDQLGQHQAARADFERALRIDACLAESRRNLGMSLCSATER